VQIDLGGQSGWTTAFVGATMIRSLFRMDGGTATHVVLGDARS
jgi:hypothetical protein